MSSHHTARQRMSRNIRQLLSSHHTARQRMSRIYQAADE